MRWYIPTWNGDIRAESTDSGTRLTIIDPTPRELMTLGRLEHQFREQGWWKGDAPLWNPSKDRRRKASKRQEIDLPASLADIAPMLIEGYKPGQQTLTAIVYRDGEIETVDGTQGATALAVAADKAVKKKATKATTVKRATPCCPQCMPGSIEPASEVLLDFLTEREHRTWAEKRYIIVRGGRTGHRYLLAHRHSSTAVDLGRIVFDLDDRTVLHFHDNSVPPEEEVLGAKLVLEHREHWLRNEATVLHPSLNRDGSADHSHQPTHIFDNPFGDHMDGVEDAAITQTIGSTLMGMAHGLGASPAEDWWIRELGQAIERALGGVEEIEEIADPVDYDRDPDVPSDGWLDAREDAFFEDACTLGRASPKALAHVCVHWRRRAMGYAAPDWGSA